MASRFMLQVIDRHTGSVAKTWAPGLHAERDFVEEIVTRTLEKGVGLGRTSAHVAADVRAAIADVLKDIKADVHPTQ